MAVGVAGALGVVAGGVFVVAAHKAAPAPGPELVITLRLPAEVVVVAAQVPKQQPKLKPVLLLLPVPTTVLPVITAVVAPMALVIRPIRASLAMTAIPVPPEKLINGTVLVAAERLPATIARVPVLPAFPCPILLLPAPVLVLPTLIAAAVLLVPANPAMTAIPAQPARPSSAMALAAGAPLLALTLLVPAVHAFQHLTPHLPAPVLVLRARIAAASVPRQVLSAGARLLLRSRPEVLIRYFAITAFLRTPLTPFPGRVVAYGAALGRGLPPSLTAPPAPQPGHFPTLAGLAILPLITIVPELMR